jgi:hypothetical protein
MKTKWPGLICFVVLAACGNGLEVPGTGDSATTCSAHTDAKSCSDDARCVTFAPCPVCPGQAPVFVSCLDKDANPPPYHCAESPCITACGHYTTQSSCDADSTCISVFSNAALCNSPSCTPFDHCANKPAQCGPGTGTCPNQKTLLCAGPYTEVWEGACAIGCVRVGVCNPPPQGQ